MSLRHAILGLLAETPSSGYDLMKRFETSLAHVWPAKQSQVYGELAKLSEAGLIEVTGTGARNRREYGITDAGRAELKEWMTGPGADGAYRSAALLRVFFLWTLPREEGAAYLKEFARRNQERHAFLEAVRDGAQWRGDPVQVCEWLALEFGIRGSKSTGEWAEWAAEQLTEHM
ncbi:PadR family transcriptional regulator [Kitasatospora sp. RB6PN24]|uniref:PadR family transcriptional regulator n=1 Tax=Kitasatospora humi TaxID=2893891 RepID=UPI001E2AAF6A|nr:PadR family transcriptional regulator [Kitasatospora humi]MCC9311292.1 PadR family transcriptional regulator [Kitasatospora humi]